MAEHNNLLRTIEKYCIDLNFNVDGLAEKVGLSTRYLREQSYSYYGMSLHRLIETVRLQHAIKMLSSDETILSLIPPKVGYRYCKTFRQAFKKRFNLTPQECREKFLQAKDKSTEIESWLKVLWKNSAKNDLR